MTTQAISPLATTCPQEIARVQRQARNRKRERDPELMAMKKKWCEGKVCDCGCGRPADTPHHPFGALYENDSAYADPTNWEPYYHTCHHCMHHGFERCPGCGGWMRPGHEKCAICRGTVTIKQKRNGGKYRCTRKDHHPCRFHQIAQRCTVRHICCYSPKRCRECERFQERKR